MQTSNFFPCWTFGTSSRSAEPAPQSRSWERFAKINKTCAEIRQTLTSQITNVLSSVANNLP